MKTYHIKDLLKKEVLIIEWQDDYEIVGRIIFGKSNQKGVLENLFNLDGYTLLGKPDEIKEEDVKDLVRSGSYTTTFWNHKTNDNHKSNQLKTAIESFNSALESEIYWNVNPLGDYSVANKRHIVSGSWREAQEKTFDRNRSIILVKN